MELSIEHRRARRSCGKIIHEIIARGHAGCLFHKH